MFEIIRKKKKKKKRRKKRIDHTVKKNGRNLAHSSVS